MMTSGAPPLPVLALFTVVVSFGVCSNALPNGPVYDPASPDPESGLDNPLVWVASNGFSSIQGVNDWSYRFEESPGKLKDLAWNSDGYWEAPAVTEELRITATGQTPATGRPIVRSWRAPYNGTVRVEGHAAMAADTCPEGPTASIRHGESVRWERTLNDGTPASHQETIEVARGDVIGFRVVPGGGARLRDGHMGSSNHLPRRPRLLAAGVERRVQRPDAHRSPTRPSGGCGMTTRLPACGCPDLTVSDGEQQDWLIDTWQRADNIVVADGVATLHTRHDGPGRQPFSGAMMDTRGRIEPNGGVAPAVRLDNPSERGGSSPGILDSWAARTPSAPTSGTRPSSTRLQRTGGARRSCPASSRLPRGVETGTTSSSTTTRRRKRWENQARGHGGLAVVRSWQAPHSGRVRGALVGGVAAGRFRGGPVLSKSRGKGPRLKRSSAAMGLGSASGSAEISIPPTRGSNGRVP